MPYLRTRLGRWFADSSLQELGGHGPSFVLLPPLFTDGRFYRPALAAWQELNPILPVDIVDGPGHGRSETVGEFSLEDQADALVDAIDVLGRTRVVVSGIGWGAQVAARFAIRYPSRCAGVMLGQLVAGAPSRTESLGARLLAKTLNRAGMPPALFRKVLLPANFSPAYFKEGGAAIDALVQAIGGFSFAGLSAATRAVHATRTSLWDDLAQVRVRSLLISPTGANAPDHNEVLRLASALAQSEVLSVDGGHYWPLEFPAQFAEVASAFARKALIPTIPASSLRLQDVNPA